METVQKETVQAAEGRSRRMVLAGFGAAALGGLAAVGLGAVLLVVGAVFVWFRGASREQEVTEDELDMSMDTEEAAVA